MSQRAGTSSSSSSSSSELFDAHIASIRATELPQLVGSSSGLYLDAAAAPPFPSTSILGSLHKDLSTNLYSNPHSGAPAARRTAQAIDGVRKSVLKEIFGVDESANAGWDLVFTSGATDSLKLVAESFDWYGSRSASTQRRAGTFAYLNQSHTSLSGLRSLASSQGASVRALDEDALMTWSQRQDGNDGGCGGSSLVALPLQCNATGRRYIDLVNKLGRAVDRTPGPQAAKTFILLDASSYLSSSSRWPTERIPLAGPHSRDAPDFIAFSFYKIFGYPTGLGGLLVRRDAEVHAALNGKRYFGGGTLALSLSYRDPCRPDGKGKEKGRDLPSLIPSRALARRLEDGTLNFYGILAVQHAMDAHQCLLNPDNLGADGEGALLSPALHDQSSWSLRKKHVRSLTRRLYRGLGALHHSTSRSSGNEPQWLVDVYTQSRSGQRWIQQGRSWATAQRVLYPSRQELQAMLDDDDAEEFVRDNDQGPIALFNLLTPRSTTSSPDLLPSIISPFEAGRLATLLSIHLRVGRHCNAGVMEEVVGVSRERLWKLWNEDGVGCAGEEEVDSDAGWVDADAVSQSAQLSQDDLIADDSSATTLDDDEHPGAAIRVSLCTWNTKADIDSFLDFLLKFFVIDQRKDAEGRNAAEIASIQTSAVEEEERDGAYLQSMTLYPIKSCSGQHFGRPFNQEPPEQPTGWIEEATCDDCGCVVLRPSTTDDVSAPPQPPSTSASLPCPSSPSFRSLSSSQSDRLFSSDATGRSAGTPPSSVRSGIDDEKHGRSGIELVSPALQQQSATHWPLTSYGLLHDREWCLVSVPSGSASAKTRILSQKRHTRMALIRARVERSFGNDAPATVHSDHVGSLVVDLMREGGIEYERRLILRFGSGENCERSFCSLRDTDDELLQGVSRNQSAAGMCAALANGTVVSGGPDRHPCALVQEAFSNFLDVDCTLARLSAVSGRHRHSHLSKSGPSGTAPETADSPATDVIPILLSNESPFLVVCQESVNRVRDWVREDATEPQDLDQDWSHVNASSFRPNFVVAGKVSSPVSQPPVAAHALEPAHPEPLPEDGVERFEIGPHVFGALGHCRRCEMVGIDQETGERVPEILGALSRRRRRLQGGKGSGAAASGSASGAGRVEFGEHLHWLRTETSTETGGDDQRGWDMISVGMPVRMI
ncbi:unnamed protein product [Tilletia controversa]|uniref:MOSC domain-containing protein n=2 Tax=Tilletia TaxID=13289 RepID=A0A177VB03_9BASI|nr:hypothetical protein CF336_g5092 [Tilletia laevis]KAE8258740.1 hypothetical protein A4X03_0g4295 [Tilletia caries]CAD6934702.1 unnamed protein product [Tilletia controversa]KAE8195200.1 hypothetical protein CF335_g5151 [Tilletia laevis]CAD6885184.1 unnamed protein product [Tilletia caries]